MLFLRPPSRESAPPPPRPFLSTDVFERPLRHLVALERRLSEDELDRVAAVAAPRIGVTPERLRRFLDRKGSEPLTTTLDTWTSVTFADTLREAGAPVRLRTTPRPGPNAGRDTGSGVRVGRPATPSIADGDAGRTTRTTVVRAAPAPAAPRWARTAFWALLGATWLALIAANVVLLA